MINKIASVVILALLLTSILTLAFNIQPVKASETIYIRSDGSIDPPTAPVSTVDNVTYTFTGNISDEIVVERSHIKIDGKGYTLQSKTWRDGYAFYLQGITNVTIKNTNIEEFISGFYLNFTLSNVISGNNITNSSRGVYLSSSSNNTISGNNITNSNCGVYLGYSSNNTISENNITNNGDGVYLVDSSSNNMISGNNITNNWWGIRLLGSSDYNSISGNNITANKYEGIYLWSNYNSISGNNITDNGEGIDLWSSNNTIFGNTFFNDGLFAFFYGNVVVDNLVNGKPLVYLEGVSDYIVEYAGQVILVNCTGMQVENLDLSKTIVGVQLFGTNNTNISGNNITANKYGIHLYDSSNNRISGNNITNNNNYGIELCYYSSNNSISGNNITNNGDGIRLYYSSNNNSISVNNITANNEDGIHLVGCSNNTILGNNITANNGDGIHLYSSSNNLILHNSFVDNKRQFYTPHSVNVWDDGYPSGGNYWSNYGWMDEKSGPYQDQPGSDGIGDMPYIIYPNNVDNYPLMKPYGGLCDIGITSLTTSKTVVGQGYCLNVTIKALNYGINLGTFNVTAHVNTTIIGTLVNVTLTSRNYTTISFTWNTTGWSRGNYTISVIATSVPGETDLSDNNSTGGWVFVTIQGDVDGDRDVDIYDVVKITGIYGSKRGDPQFNPNSDLDDDGEIKIYDVVRCTSHYGQSW